MTGHRDQLQSLCFRVRPRKIGTRSFAARLGAPKGPRSSNRRSSVLAMHDVPPHRTRLQGIMPSHSALSGGGCVSTTKHSLGSTHRWPSLVSMIVVDNVTSYRSRTADQRVVTTTSENGRAMREPQPSLLRNGSIRRLWATLRAQAVADPTLVPPSEPVASDLSRVKGKWDRTNGTGRNGHQIKSQPPRLRPACVLASAIGP